MNVKKTIKRNFKFLCRYGFKIRCSQINSEYCVVFKKKEFQIEVQVYDIELNLSTVSILFSYKSFKGQLKDISTIEIEENRKFIDKLNKCEYLDQMINSYAVFISDNYDRIYSYILSI